jgi:RNase P subunit RPR2
MFVDLLEKTKGVKKTETNKKSFVISKCHNCGSPDIRFIENFEHKFDNKIMVDNVYMCNTCNNIHFMEGDSVVCEYVYSPSGMNSEINCNFDK